MKIMMFNGLLLFLLFMWTSAETGPETELTEEIQVYANESRVSIQARKRACENLGGKCIKKKKDCPSRWHLETKPGKPYCSKNHRCCYPGPSCNLVWNYKEERPLIMIRDSKTIVPPVLDIEVSDYPSRIPIGRKLIFACPGANNQFNHVEGTHTKLHGECISHEQFKVCVNSNLVKLNLSQLSCSIKMHPSFIKDNSTSDKNSCDGIGGEPYKQGYTYGDKHEFKDLEIEVCFSKKNQTTLCTSSNLHGNETDYRTAIKEPPGRDTRMDPQVPPPKCGGVTDCSTTSDTCKKKGIQFGSVEGKCQNSNDDCIGRNFEPTFIEDFCNKGCSCCVKIDCSTTTDKCKKQGIQFGLVEGKCQNSNDDCIGNNFKPTDTVDFCNNKGCSCCVKIDCSQKTDKCTTLGEDRGVEAKCIPVSDKTECTGGEFRTNSKSTKYCKDKRCGCCAPYNPCPSKHFPPKHLCDNCINAKTAKEHCIATRGQPAKENGEKGGILIYGNTVFYTPTKDIRYNFIRYEERDACEMRDYYQTWDCTAEEEDGKDIPKGFWKECKLHTPSSCTKGTSALDTGHFWRKSINHNCINQK